ncbi:ABC transporter permease [Microbacterium trichothecenolyticum]|uniref:ABC transporter permease n=1 Tax=Microbacterium ureisolvens TaxID=2781186 RepID=A0ABS7HYD2_9MICO|nr:MULTISPECIES: ABC transporter permease [Microbacterium]MBW9110396.1 ABC transporter permease [Microbacterium ureisolvens]MBW9120501.1 ABC transporter permease [Microbacterium trichothecenolyticum]
MSRVQDFLQRRSWAFAFVLALILLIVNLVVSPSFLSPERLPATFATLAPFVLVGFASTPAILSGGIDISVGPLATLINCLFIAVLLPAGWGEWYIAVPILLLTSAAVGTVTGVLVAVVRLHPVVASIGVFFVLVGAAVTISKQPVSAPANWSDALAGSWGWFPAAALTMGIVALAWFALRRTAFVSNLLATGESDISAYGSGVDVTLVRVLAYTLGGVFAGVGGIALSALLQSSQSSLATTYALLGIAAAVLGGASLGGGRGGLLGTFLGAVVIYLVQQLLTAAGVQPSLIQVTYGLVLVLGVLLGATLLSPRLRRSRA